MAPCDSPLELVMQGEGEGAGGSGWAGVGGGGRGGRTMGCCRRRGVSVGSERTNIKIWLPSWLVREFFVR